MTVISCETLTPQCSLCRHFIYHSVDGARRAFNPAAILADPGNQKIVLGSMAHLGSPARCQADHSRRVGIAAYIPGTVYVRIGKESVVANAVEPARQNVQEESSDELVC
jgi:hypothetical protein